MSEIKYFNLNPKTDTELIRKLNEVAKLENLLPHSLGKSILLTELDRRLKVNQTTNQPAAAG